LELQIITKDKSKRAVIKEITAHVDNRMEKEDSTVPEKNAFLQTLLATLKDTMPPLELSDKDKELVDLESQYVTMKKAQKAELKAIELKLKALKTPTEAAANESITITGPHDAKTPIISTQFLRREFKISCQIGEPG